MSFRPIGHYLSLRFRPPETRTKSGLYLPKPIYSQIAVVLAAGEMVKDVKVGDTIIVHKHGEAMEVQMSLWHYYILYHLNKPEKVKDFEVAPVVVTDEDIIGKWSDKVGLIPLKRNVVILEHEYPEKENGIIRVVRHRQNRKTTGVVQKASKQASLKKGDIVLLGKFGGVYFIDRDGKEKVLAASGEALGIFTKFKPNSKISAGAPREQLDPNLGIPETV